MSKVPLYQRKNNKSFSPNIRIWLYSVLQLLQLFNKNCCKGAAIFGVPLLWLSTTAVTHIIIIIIIIKSSNNNNNTVNTCLKSELQVKERDLLAV